MNNHRTFNLIDKKRALERIIYEKTKTQFNNKKHLPQNLIYPIKIDINTSDLQILEECRNTIEKAGYQFKKISNYTIEISSTPNGISSNEIQDLFEFFIEEFKKGNEDINEKIMEKTIIKITYNEYKKSQSIKSMNNNELKSIITMLLNCKTPFIGINGQPCVINIEPNIFFN